VAAFVVELPADRFVEDLFPSLAWAATVRLADPVMGSRLVERVLRQAWDDRERFATPELLYEHVRHAARVAIEREAERRLATVRFDEAASMLIPGDLHALTVQSVQRRLQAMSSTAAVVRTVSAPEERSAPVLVAKPVAAPPVAAPPVAAPPVAAPLVAASPVAAPSVAASPVAAPSVAAKPVAAPSVAASSSVVSATSEPRPTVAKWAAKSAGAAHAAGAADASGAAAPKASGAPSGPRGRAPFKGAHAARDIAREGGVRLSPRIIGGIGVIVVSALIVAWRVLGSTPADELAIAALSDGSGMASATKQAEELDVMLPGGGSVHLGSNATLRSSSEFAAGARALRLTGPAIVRMAVDSTKPTAIASGTLRWMTYGVSAAFDRVGNHILVQVDSGALELVGDSTRTLVSAGSSVRVDASAVVTALSAAERDAAFAWRTGRLTLTRESGQRIVDEVTQWFGLAVRFTPALTAAESLSVDVPLRAVDSLSAALGVAVGGTVERDGQQLTVSAAPPPPPPPVVAPKRVSSRRSRSDATSASRPAARRSTASVELADIRLPELKILTQSARPPR
jgi:hypothetical protein